ncbi:hypothetical protein JCM3774_001094 [Rhodotorula dairenensis]
MSALSRNLLRRTAAAVNARVSTSAVAMSSSSAAAITCCRPTSRLVAALPASTQRPFSCSAVHRAASPANDPKWKAGEKVTYSELKPLTQSPDDKILLIDVREPNEVALGSIPSSVNLPLSTFEKSLSMDEGDFTRVNGFHKPTKQQPMIFYCRSGVRAQTAVDLAKAAGYKLSRNYEGSYLDWQKHEESNPNKDD